jgi:hypothetical protein
LRYKKGHRDDFYKSPGRHIVPGLFLLFLKNHFFFKMYLTIHQKDSYYIQVHINEQKDYEAQLDSLIDMVSFGICPAVFLLSYGEFPWFLPGAFVIVATSAIRLSYFNIFGLVDSTTYI